MFAAGNEGDMGYFSVHNPGLAKNALTVGAAENPHPVDATFDQDYLAYFSSIGPTFDYRIKPDVVAPGYYIYSAQSTADATSQSCSVIRKAGTSMATPGVAGNAALVREYFEVNGHLNFP